MSLSQQTREALTYLHAEGGFDEIKEISRDLHNDDGLTFDEALDRGVDLFDAVIDFDRMLNGRFEKLGDFLERNDGPLLRPMVRIALRHLLRKWAQAGMS